LEITAENRRATMLRHAWRRPSGKSRLDLG
jgi:hypothetical protein